MIKQTEPHYNIELGILIILLILFSSCSTKKNNPIVDEFCPPIDYEIKEFEGKMYVEDIFMKDTINFSNYGTDSFYRSYPTLIKQVSSNLENDYKIGSFVLFKSDTIKEKLILNKIKYQNENNLFNTVDSLSKNSTKMQTRNIALLKKFKKKGLKSAFRYKEINLKIRYIFSGCYKVWIPDFKKNNNLVEQIKVPIYSIIDITPVNSK